jgi:hypothetical protein
MTQIQSRDFTAEEMILLETSMDNCYAVFDPAKTQTREQMIDLIDRPVNPEYYVVLFLGNTCELFRDKEDNNMLTVEMIAKIGKYLREKKGNPRTKLFDKLSN